MKASKNDRRLDRTNLRILECLSQNGRISYSELADKLGCSINTVRDRIFAMERRGVIRGYEAIVDQASLGRPVRCMVLLEPDRGMQRPKELREALETPEILSAELTTGRHVLVLEMASTDMASLHDTIRSKVYPLGFTNARVVQLGPAASMEADGTVDKAIPKTEVVTA